MNRLNKQLFWLMLTFLLVACQSYKKVPYLQDVEVIEQTTQQEKMYDAKIMPKDLLYHVLVRNWLCHLILLLQVR